MKEVSFPQPPDSPAELDAATFLACVATILELPFDQLPDLQAGEDPPTGVTLSRWLGGLRLGLAPVADARSFRWPGPWIARVRPPAQPGPIDARPADAPARPIPAPPRRAVVMYGVPAGVVWDPGGDGELELDWIEDGFLIAAGDIAQALPPAPAAPTEPGVVEQLWVAPAAGVPGETRGAVTVLPGYGLQGDRHVTGDGTFPSPVPGSALTLIEAEVCASFDPPLTADEHRRNVVTRGIELNRLVGVEFTIGAVRCRGMRLCEPCTVIQRYAGRPILRALVHRGGLRADILTDGEIAVGDQVRPLDGRAA